jgi:hypothetical protein
MTAEAPSRTRSTRSRRIRSGSWRRSAVSLRPSNTMKNRRCGHLAGGPVPEPLKSGDELGVEHGHLAVKDQRDRIQLAEGGHDARKPARVVPAVPTHQLDGVANPRDELGEGSASGA